MTSAQLARRVLAAIPWVLVVVLTVLNVLAMSRLGPNDDAYITYRVARNLANGLGPVFNPGERVLTVTTPGYMLLLAASSLFSQDFVLLGLVLNGLALLAVGALLIDLSAWYGSTQPDADPLGLISALAATLAVAITLTFPLLSAAIGMETPLFMAAILAAFAAYRRATGSGADRSLERRWLSWTAVAAALAFLLRPDGLLVAIAVALHWLATRRRMVGRPVVLFIALSVPWLAAAWLYYGSPIPNTLVAKETQSLGEAVLRWGPGLVQSTAGWAQQFPLAALLAAIGLVLGLIRRQTGRIPMLLWATMSIAAHTLLDVRSYFWYYAPFAPVAALLASDAASAGAGWLASLLGRRRVAGLATAVIALALALVALVPAAAAAATLAEPPEPRRREQAYLRSGELLAELCASEGDSFRVGLSEIGLIGYVSDCPIVDFAGLLQRDVAHLRLPAAGKIAWAIQRYQPEAVVLSGGMNYPATVSRAPWFRQRYEPLDQQELDGYRSVLYRRSLGPETQRDLPGAAWWRSSTEETSTEAVLYFEPGASPNIALHTFVPLGSSLSVAANGQPVMTIAGSESGWQETRLPALAPASEIRLSLAGTAGDQPALAAWVESNALPAVHYFVPLEDASTRPRPTIRLEPGESRRVQLARPGDEPVALEVLYRDRPGVRLAVTANDEPLAVVGGTNSWRVDHLSVPEAQVYTVELRNQGDTAVRVAHVALVQPFGAAAPEEVPNQ